MKLPPDFQCVFDSNISCRSFFGALLLAQERNGELTYAGEAGTGFSNALLKTLFGKIMPLTQYYLTESDSYIFRRMRYALFLISHLL
jgi:hypothetical protein